MTEAAKTELELATEAAQAKADETNKSRSGKGTRVKAGLTRGRNPQVVSFEAFNEKLPETLPVTISEFMDLTKVQDEPTIMGYLIDGFNSASYTTASDPVAEFVEASWEPEIQKGFRTVVRNFATNNGMSIEDAANLIKPAYLKSQEKK